MQKTLYFATHNAHKLEEARQILGRTVNVLSLGDLGCHDDIPEDADTLEGNSLIKARYVWDNFSVDCFADDTGLEVDALDGRPGVYTARFAKNNNFHVNGDSSDNWRYLLSLLEGKTNRSARFRTAITLIINGEVYQCEGVVNGTIAYRPSGLHGFGYDPVFVPDGYSDTFAQLPAKVKNSISHRANALRSMLELPVLQKYFS